MTLTEREAIEDGGGGDDLSGSETGGDEMVAVFGPAGSGGVGDVVLVDITSEDGGVIDVAALGEIGFSTGEAAEDLDVVFEDEGSGAQAGAALTDGEHWRVGAGGDPELIAGDGGGEGASEGVAAAEGVDPTRTRVVARGEAGADEASFSKGR